MQFYKFLDENTGEHIERLLTRSEMEKFLKDNPHLKRVFEFPAINTSNSATFVEGHIPQSRKQAMDLERKIANLTATEYGTKPSERGEIKKEISELKKRRKAPIGTNKGNKEQ